MQTKDVAARVSLDLGLSQALSEREVNSILRGWPVDEVPPVVSGKRRWAVGHVTRLRDQIRDRRKRAGSGA
jgi:hypothetical protein